MKITCDLFALRADAEQGIMNAITVWMAPVSPKTWRELGPRVEITPGEDCSITITRTEMDCVCVLGLFLTSDGPIVGYIDPANVMRPN